MPPVLVEPLGVVFEVDDDESLMDAAERAGYSWPTICGGVAMCTLCWVRIEAGEGNVSAMATLERDALETYRWDGARKPEGSVRLACQIRLTGPATVFKRGVGGAGRSGVYR